MDGITTMQLLFSYNVKVTYFTNVIKSSGDVTANPTMGREKKRIQFQVKVHRYIRVWVNFQCLCFGKSVNGRATSWLERNERCLLKYWFVVREITRNVQRGEGSVLENTETSEETPDWKKAKVPRFRETCLVGRGRTRISGAWSPSVWRCWSLWSASSSVRSRHPRAWLSDTEYTLVLENSGLEQTSSHIWYSYLELLRLLN